MDAHHIDDDDLDDVNASPNGHVVRRLRANNIARRRDSATSGPDPDDVGSSASPINAFDQRQLSSSDGGGSGGRKRASTEGDPDAEPGVDGEDDAEAEVDADADVDVGDEEPSKSGDVKRPGRKKDPNAQQLRKIQNRIAQREFRQRKQQYIKSLEARVDLLSTDHDSQIDRLRQVIRALIDENTTLRNFLVSFATFFGDGVGRCVEKLGMSEDEFRKNTLERKSMDTAIDVVEHINAASHVPPDKGKAKAKPTPPPPPPPAPPQTALRKSRINVGEDPWAVQLGQVPTKRRKMSDAHAPVTPGPPAPSSVGGASAASESSGRGSGSRKTCRSESPISRAANEVVAAATASTSTVPSPFAVPPHQPSHPSQAFTSFMSGGAGAGTTTGTGAASASSSNNQAVRRSSASRTSAGATLRDWLGNSPTSGPPGPAPSPGASPFPFPSPWQSWLNPPTPGFGFPPAEHHNGLLSNGGEGGGGDAPSETTNTAQQVIGSPLPLDVPGSAHGSSAWGAQSGLAAALNVSTPTAPQGIATPRSAPFPAVPMPPPPGASGRGTTTMTARPAVSQHSAAASSSSPSNPYYNTVSHVTTGELAGNPLTRLLGSTSAMVDRFFTSETPQKLVETFQVLSYHMYNARLNASYNLPPALRPTVVQRTVPHDHVIDGIIIAGLRDRMILFSGRYVLAEAMVSLMENIEIHGDDVLIPSNWEIKRPWLQRYWYLVDDQLLKICNRWRSARGERELTLQELTTRRTTSAEDDLSSGAASAGDLGGGVGMGMGMGMSMGMGAGMGMDVDAGFEVHAHGQNDAGANVDFADALDGADVSGSSEGEGER